MTISRASVLSVFTVLAVVGSVVAGISVSAQDLEPVGPTKPVLEQNLDAQGRIRVHEQGVADVDIKNSNLDVTLSNEELDVNVTNGNLPVVGEVDVTNFPATQNVNVQNLPATQDVNVQNLPATQDVRIVGGSTGVQPVTAMRQLIFNTDGQEEKTFSTMAVSSIVIVSGTDEYEIHGGSPLAGGELFLGYQPDGAEPTTTMSFPQPIPLNMIKIYCANESDTCNITVLLSGF